MNHATILIVDDDPISLTLLSKVVERLNYRALTAESGERALELLQVDPVDLIVADYDMPGMTGLQLLKQVKVTHPRLPFILVTAYSNLKVVREAWEHGAFDFFQKPVFVDRLQQTISLAIEYGHLSMARRKFPHIESAEPDPDVLDVGVIRELALAIANEDLAQLLEEFAVHARIELEQIFRFHTAGNTEQVRAFAHRLAGTSVNVGLSKLALRLRAIEEKPTAPITARGELEQLLEKSIYWLDESLKHIRDELKVG